MKKILIIMVIAIAATMFSGCAKRTVSTRMSASAATAQLKSEGMRIWSRPLEVGFVIDETQGDNGRIVATYPKPGEKITEKLTQAEVAAANQAHPNQGLFGGGAPTAYVFGSNSFDFNSLPRVQQAAVLSIIKDYNLDGFYVTMIEETTATTVGKNSGHRNFQVVVKGLALRIKDYGEVSAERVDAVRKEEAGNKEVYVPYVR